jgi:hypothetical protein
MEKQTSAMDDLARTPGALRAHSGSACRRPYGDPKKTYMLNGLLLTRDEASQIAINCLDLTKQLDE